MLRHIGGSLTKSENVIKTLKISGKKIIFRYPNADDVKELAATINELVEEGAEIAKTTKVSVNEEKKWLMQVMDAIKRKEKVMLLAEMDGKVIGGCEVSRDSFDVSRHVGTLGVGLQRESRGLGIGKLLIKSTMAESKKKMGLRLIKLYVFSTNKSGLQIYERLGFQKAGRIRKGVYHNGTFKDDIIMTRSL